MSRGGVLTRTSEKQKAHGGTTVKRRKVLKAVLEEEDEEDDGEETCDGMEESDISMANEPEESTRAPKRQQRSGNTQETKSKKRKIWVEIKGKRYEARYWKE